MARFSVPARQGKSLLVINNFLGVDFTNHPTNVSETRSPNAVNMIRDVPGKVRKALGYFCIDEYPGRINGVHVLEGVPGLLVHAGTLLYRRGPEEDGGAQSVLLYSGAADERSKSWQFGSSLYLADGQRLLVYNGETVVPVGEVAKVPLFSIGNSPTGNDGEVYEDLNLLQPRFAESFLGTQTGTQYQLGFAPLDTAPVTAEVLNAAGEWQPLAENTGFTVDRQAGVVTFNTAPGKSPLEGEDNVKITAARTVPGYAERINQCCIGIAYGVGGAADRLFLAGNPAFANYDWFSGQNDPTYFGDLAYSVVGGAASAIMGYSLLNGSLATHKDARDAERNVVLREGSLVDAKPAFPVVGTQQGVGAISRHSFGYLAGEPLFFTGLGIYAITPQDITGEKYAQNRSFYLNGKLLQEPEPEEAFAFVHKDLYWLCLNGKAYILDGLQPNPPERSMPFATRQYSGFYRTGLPARVMWQQNGALHFGSEEGKLYRFYENPENQESYNDDGQPIYARWETPDIDGRLFYKNKTFQYMVVRLASAVATSLGVYGFKRGFWALLAEDSTKARYLDFGRLIFSKFTFSGDFTPKIIGSKIRLGKADKVRFAFENNELNEPFGLFDIALEYRESGNAR